MYNRITLFQFFIFLFSASFFACSPATETANDGPYFGNGFRNGWADQTSIVIWTRLTKTPEANIGGKEFLAPTRKEHDALDKGADAVAIYKAQIPEGLTLKDMDGFCQGAEGEVRLSYAPATRAAEKIETDWKAVDPQKNHSTQWRLGGLQPNTTYLVTLESRSVGSEVSSDTITGKFVTPPAEGTEKDLKFCVVSCHDYNRRDVPDKGHQIYPSMQALAPDFYVHTGDIEYYDKPKPFAMTEELMYFKWNRLFALPYQREFYTQFTTYFEKDDHDALTNDVYPGMSYGTVSFERGLEIFDKIQFPANDKPYKTIRWGKDLQIWLLEGRNYRSKNTDPDGPEKTLLGKEQKEWLYRTVEASDASFRVIISPDPILGPDRKNKHDNLANDNFQHEGDEIRSFFDQFDNVYLCNGDRHWQYVTHLEGTNLWEFGSGAGSDIHAGGWKQDDVRPQHRFLRVKGGFLSGEVNRKDGAPAITFRHHDVNGKIVHEEVFPKKEESM